MTRKVLNVEVMRTVMRTVLSKVWKIHGRLQVKEVGDKMVLFHFDDPSEKDRIFLSQTWAFNKALLVLHEFDGMSTLGSICMDYYPFWV
ncbi:hypothetical protein REPUB_Repub04eG0161200 [Reevesia pubescens]